MQENTPSLRERRRAETFRQIHRAAWTLARADGYCATTVEEIAERAGVSRRTFFNYFESKEDAVLGLQPVAVPAAALERYVDPDAGDEFSRTVRLFMAVLRHSSCFHESVRHRRELIATHPELDRRIGLHITAAESLVTATVIEHGGSRSPARKDMSQAYVLMAGSVLKYVFRNNRELTASSDRAVVDQAVDRGLSVFRRAFKEIS